LTAVATGSIIVAVAASQALGVTTVSRSGNTITITGGDEANFVEQPTMGDPLLYSDAGGLNFGAGCVDFGPVSGKPTVQCGTYGPGLVANVSLGGGDDTFQPDATLITAPRLVVDLGPGNDTMWGSALADDIRGGAGDDNINGRGGNDTLDGGDGNDRLSGASGDDTVIGGPGRDSLFGDGEFSGFSYGNDTLQARDGEQDALSCSFGADTAVADANDIFDVLGDCESRDISSGTAPGPGPGVTPPPGATPLQVGLAAPATAKLRALAAGKPLRFRVQFTAACRTTATLVLRAPEARKLRLPRRLTVIGRDSAQVPDAGIYAATLKVLPKYRPALRRARNSVKVDIRVVCRDASGATAAATRRVNVTR
jgi:hypothetical protein